MRSGSEKLIAAQDKPTPSPEAGEKPAKIQKLFFKNSTIDDSIEYSSKNMRRIAEHSHVYKTEENVTYACNLYKIDLQRSSANRFYLLKILAEDSGLKFWVVRQYGEMGYPGDQTESSFDNKEKAIALFRKTFEEKTGNIWSDEFCVDFTKKREKYVMLDIDYQQHNAERILDKYLKHTWLDEPTQELINILFKAQLMKQKEMKFDLNRNLFPLGSISKEDIKEGIQILMKINKILNLCRQPLTAQSQNSIHQRDREKFLIHFSNMFYEKIPHPCSSGNSALPCINNKTILKQEAYFLSEVEANEIVYRLCENGPNPLTLNYQSLGINIKTLMKESEEYETINQYALDTFVANHTDFKVEIQNIFALEKAHESERFEAYNKSSNRMLVFHGSRTMNFVGILKRGLLIDPLESIILNGSLFGNGIYFTDVFSQACVYSKRPTNVKQGLILVCEVALGQMYEVTHTLGENFERKDLPEGKSSVKGIGKFCPERFEELADGTLIPKGPIKGDYNKVCEAVHNEYVVFNEDQVKMRYLIQISFIDN